MTQCVIGTVFFDLSKMMMKHVHVEATSHQGIALFVPSYTRPVFHLYSRWLEPNLSIKRAEGDRTTRLYRGHI